MREEMPVKVGTEELGGSGQDGSHEHRTLPDGGECVV
jgi:hypothetical protein